MFRTHRNIRGRGAERKREGQPHAKAISDVGEPPMWGKDSDGHALQIACDVERSLSNAWWQINRRTQGCMVANQQAHPRATRTPGSMGTTALKRRLSAPC